MRFKPGRLLDGGGRSRPRIGLALGGGAARGLAHIGVLRVLAEAGIPVDYLAGTSAGSIIAGAYAAGLGPEQLAALAREVRWRDLGRLTISTMGLQSNQRLEQLLLRHLPVNNFGALKTPLAVVAADVLSGSMVVIKEGDLARAIRASCTIPGIYVPVPDDQGRLLIDGGFVNNLPAAVAREMGADYVIAVTVNSHLRMGSAPTNVFEVMLQAMALASRSAEGRLRQDADLVVRPVIHDVRWDDLSRVDELIQTGEEAMRSVLPEVTAALHARPDGFLQRLRRRLAPETRPGLSQAS